MKSQIIEIDWTNEWKICPYFISDFLKNKGYIVEDLYSLEKFKLQLMSNE